MYVVLATSEALTFEYVPSVVPRAIQDSATDAGATPVPESEIAAGEFEAFLVTVGPPVTPPRGNRIEGHDEHRCLIRCELGSRTHTARAGAGARRAHRGDGLICIPSICEDNA